MYARVHQSKTTETTYQKQPLPAVRRYSMLHSTDQTPNSAARGFANPRLGHDFSKVRVYPPAPAGSVATKESVINRAGPVSVGSMDAEEEPLSVFDAQGNEVAEAPLPVAEKEKDAVVEEVTESIPGAPSGNATASPAAQPAAVTAAAAAPAAVTAAAAAALNTVILGPRKLWFFDNERPPNYRVSSKLKTNKAGGVFKWSVSPQLALSNPAAAAPTVTAISASAAKRDARVGLEHTDSIGTVSRASYLLTVHAPKSLTHIYSIDAAHPVWGYESHIHYSIHDQFRAILPRNVPINERFTAAPTADFPGMNWRRGAEGAAVANPNNWFDRIQGESAAGRVPAPVAPGGADAAVPVYHWPGEWRVGSLIIGNGSLVSSITWHKYRGFAIHIH